MFELSFRWQDGFIQLLIYCAGIVAIGWILSKIKVSDRGESSIGERGR